MTSADKVGRDAGELAGIDPVGVIATNDVDEILALDADCVHYAPLHANLDEMCRILESGKNLVTPAGFVFPDSTRPDEVERLRAACEAGGSSLHGTGIHPGFSGDLLPITMARLSFSIEQIIVQELADLRRHPSKNMVFDGLGFGRDPDEARADPSPIVLTMDKIFRESQMMLAAALGLEVDEYSHEFDVAVAKRRLEIRSGVIEKGTVGGERFEWIAWSNGKPRVVFRSFWKTDDDLEPNWDLQAPEVSAHHRRHAVGEGHARACGIAHRSRRGGDRRHRHLRALLDRDERRERDPSGVRCDPWHSHPPRPRPRAAEGPVQHLARSRTGRNHVRFIGRCVRTRQESIKALPFACRYDDSRVRHDCGGNHGLRRRAGIHR